MDLRSMRARADNRAILPRHRWIFARFYGGAIDLPTSSWFEDAYVHGSVGFSLMDSTRFIVTTSNKQVNAEVGALDDNWDHSSDAGVARIVNVLLYSAGFGNYNNMRITFEYYGPGKRLSVRR
jgi:hypothetical protein